MNERWSHIRSKRSALKIAISVSNSHTGKVWVLFQGGVSQDGNLSLIAKI